MNENKDTERKILRREFYQNKVDSIIKILNGRKFTNKRFAEELNVSRERARQIIKYYSLVVPKCDYYSSEQFKDLKRLVESGEVVNFTHEQLYKERYKEYLPKDLIRGYVSYNGKGFSITKNGILNEFFSKVQTEGKELEEIFFELQSMYPDKKHNYWAFCENISNRGLPYKRKRKYGTRPKERIASEKLTKISNELLKIIDSENIDCSLYSSSQLLQLFNSKLKTKIDKVILRKFILRNSIDIAKTKSFALINRIKSLGMNTTDNSFEEMATVHNKNFPMFPVSKKSLSSYYFLPLMTKQ